jgi:hypothetical protein
VRNILKIGYKIIVAYLRMIKQGGPRNDPVFDLELNIEPCNEQCFVTQ